MARSGCTGRHRIGGRCVAGGDQAAGFFVAVDGPGRLLRRGFHPGACPLVLGQLGHRRVCSRAVGHAGMPSRTAAAVWPRGRGLRRPLGQTSNDDPRRPNPGRARCLTACFDSLARGLACICHRLSHVLGRLPLPPGEERPHPASGRPHPPRSPPTACSASRSGSAWRWARPSGLRSGCSSGPHPRSCSTPARSSFRR